MLMADVPLLPVQLVPEAQRFLAPGAGPPSS